MRSSGPVPTTTATSSMAKISGAIASQSPWAAQAPASMVAMRVMVVLSVQAASSARAVGSSWGRPTRSTATGAPRAGEGDAEVAPRGVAVDRAWRRRRARARGSARACRRGRSRSSPRRAGGDSRPSIARAAADALDAPPTPSGRRPWRRPPRTRRARRCGRRRRCGPPRGRGRCRPASARSGSTPMPTRTWSHASRRPSLRVSCSTRSAPVAAAMLAPRTTSTPSLRCRSANQVPTTGPSTAASGASAASTIVVCTPALAAAAATSWPMKPAPTMTRRPPSRERGAQGAGVVERAQGVDVGEAVEQRQAARAAAGGDEQLLVADARRRRRA